MSGLIWVQTVYKSFQQTTLGDKELKYCITLCIDFFTKDLLSKSVFAEASILVAVRLGVLRKSPSLSL